MADNFQSRVQPLIEGLLEPGETLTGICAATQQSAFRGNLVALAVTDRRLLIQPVGRRFEAKGESLSLLPEEIAAAKAEGAGGGWANVAPSVMEGVAVTLKLRTTGGEKRKLHMMRGGEGMLGKLGGGEDQQRGIEALARFFASS